MRNLTRLLLALGLAIALVGGLVSGPAGAHPDRAERQTTVQAPATTDSFGYDVCAFTNPNPSGYAVTHWQVSVYQGNPGYINGIYHQDIRVFCHWVPFVSPNYGDLCRIIDRHNNPTNATAPGEGWNWRVILDYYPC